VTPWQINVELRMTPEDAAGLLAVLDREKHGLLVQALEFQIADFAERGFTPGATTDDYHSEPCPSCHPGHSVRA
jgi:hypothetical protein